MLWKLGICRYVKNIRGNCCGCHDVVATLNSWAILSQLLAGHGRWTYAMDTTLLIPQDGGQAEKGGIVNDFMYGSNVAASHIYIRMGEFM